MKSIPSDAESAVNSSQFTYYVTVYLWSVKKFRSEKHGTSSVHLDANDSINISSVCKVPGRLQIKISHNI